MYYSLILVTLKMFIPVAFLEESFLSKHHRLYQPNQYTRLPPHELYKKILWDLKKSRYLGFQLFKRDFLVRYRQSLLGLAWALIMPILTVGVFFMLFRSGILKAEGTRIPYFFYAFFGMTCWQFFTALLITTSNIATAGQNLMISVNIPRFSYCYPPILMALTDMLIRFIFLIALLLVLRQPFHLLQSLSMLLFLIPLLLIGTGIGLMLAITNSIAKDIQNLLQTALHFLMFLSPVVYPITAKQGLLQKISVWNPLSYLVDVPRQFFYFGELPYQQAYLCASGISLVIFFIGIRFYFLSISRTLEVS